MKGLLLKDWYMAKAYCRAYLFVAIVFLGVSFVQRENLFYLVYPCLFGGMIPVTLLAYDERSRFLQYSGALPYTKRQYVSAKYLFGFAAELFMWLITCAVYIAGMAVSGKVNVRMCAEQLLIILAVSMIASAATMPFMFRFGVEKGRIAYYVMIGITCFGGIIAANCLEKVSETKLLTGTAVSLLMCAAAVICLLSWLASSAFYSKRVLA